MSIWRQVLAELKTTTTEAAFKTWIEGTQAAQSDKVLTVYCPSIFAADILANQYQNKIQAAIFAVAGAELELQFRVDRTEDPRPAAAGDVFVTVIELPTEPFIKLTKYSVWFWQPLIGVIPFAVWLMLRSRDHFSKTLWGDRHRVNVGTIAETLAINRQKVTGVRRRRADGSAIWVKGAFDIITDHHLGKIEAHGPAHRPVYTARILNTLPLLTPAQVKTLSPLLRDRHRRHLDIFDIDTIRWQQLTFDTLIRPL